MESIRHAQLKGNRQRDTGPEIKLRSALHRIGLRFRLDRKIGAGRSAPRPDIVFGPARVAVLVDGCFLQSCAEHECVPSAHRDYWLPTLARNVERDQANTRALEEQGWQVIRVWEHEDMAEAADEIASVVASRRP